MLAARICGTQTRISKFKFKHYKTSRTPAPPETIRTIAITKSPVTATRPSHLLLSQKYSATSSRSRCSTLFASGCERKKLIYAEWSLFEQETPELLLPKAFFRPSWPSATQRIFENFMTVQIKVLAKELAIRGPDLAGSTSQQGKGLSRLALGGCCYALTPTPRSCGSRLSPLSDLSSFDGSSSSLERLRKCWNAQRSKGSLVSGYAGVHLCLIIWLCTVPLRIELLLGTAVTAPIYGRRNRGRRARHIKLAGTTVRYQTRHFSR